MRFKERIKKLDGVNLIILKNELELELVEIQSEMLERVRDGK